jgi:thiamine-phosphate diphosphorylase
VKTTVPINYNFEEKKAKLKGLYFILNLGLGGFSDIPIWLEGLFANGVRLLQVRAKEIHPLKLTSVTRDIVAMADKYDTKVIVNDFPEVARDAGAYGVHLGADDIEPKHARVIVGRGAVIGATARDLVSARYAINEGADYLAIGSIFPSPTKPSAPVVGLQTLTTVKEVIPDYPVCAIGGIDADNVLSVVHTGVEMIAVASAIALADNPERAAFGLATAIEAKWPEKESTGIVPKEDILED